MIEMTSAKTAFNRPERLMTFFAPSARLVLVVVVWRKFDAVDHDKGSVDVLDRPGRREAAGGMKAYGL